MYIFVDISAAYHTCTYNEHTYEMLYCHIENNVSVYIYEQGVVNGMSLYAFLSLFAMSVWCPFSAQTASNLYIECHIMFCSHGTYKIQLGILPSPIARYS